ncbi:hypothetical protein CBI38_33185 (plasmid) [Rhodococcus oxybenzonivorans]|uniref:Excalibur calcium-binding domain-containing protein n=1 Tax=Rhodococcus oxybenzonivorans TaxID=1990687 RepID=A0A2S2C6A0_9NOCA|nr:hypothetical protein CBI38_33185 [Rhodococcus oxybenzonivorans]
MEQLIAKCSVTTGAADGEDSRSPCSADEGAPAPSSDRSAAGNGIHPHHWRRYRAIHVLQSLPGRFGSSRPTPGYSSKLDRDKDGIACENWLLVNERHGRPPTEQSVRTLSEIGLAVACSPRTVTAGDVEQQQCERTLGQVLCHDWSRSRMSSWTRLRWLISHRPASRFSTRSRHRPAVLTSTCSSITLIGPRIPLRLSMTV